MTMQASLVGRERDKFVEVSGLTTVRVQLVGGGTASAAPPYADTLESGQGTIASPGTPQQITTTAKGGWMIVKANSNVPAGNLLLIGEVGNASLKIEASEAVGIELDDLSKVYIDGDSTDGFSYLMGFKN